MSTQKRVGVIGAGAGGLGATKTCLEYGLHPVCFEQRDDLGGFWHAQYPTPPHLNIQCRPYSNLHQNVMKTFYALSDFPPKPETSAIMSWQEVKDYFSDYADHFKLRPHIRFNREVTELVRADDYETTGKWVIKSVNAVTKDDETSETFDAVLVCSGYFETARRPHYPGEEKFKGSVKHSGEVWDLGTYDEKTVVLVGGSVSGVDLSNVLTDRAKKVYLVARSGCWVLPYFLDGKLWYEYWLFKPELYKTPQHFLEQGQLECLRAFDHGTLNLAPEYMLPKSPLTVSSDIHQSVLSGKLEVIKASAKEFTESGIELSNGQVIEADHVIFCTGYTTKCPFIKDRTIHPDDLSNLNSWQFILPLSQKHDTLFTIGLFHYLAGPIPTMMELCSRIACAAISGAIVLPPRKEMEDWVKMLKKVQMEMIGSYPGELPTFQRTMDLAHLLGVYPNADEIEKRSPRLAQMSREGPLYPYHFRLLGTKANWDVASKAILDSDELAFGKYGNGWTQPK